MLCVCVKLIYIFILFGCISPVLFCLHLSTLGQSKQTNSSSRDEKRSCQNLPVVRWSCREIHLSIAQSVASVNVRLPPATTRKMCSTDGH
mmetsp:Transcript_54259/g.90454  ORF Transcript_54259/g.90454 Transcript_54259/m.90454 type:complete len:90 (+) Transcript_54259:72-341(+)